MFDFESTKAAAYNYLYKAYSCTSLLELKYNDVVES